MLTIIIIVIIIFIVLANSGKKRSTSYTKKTVVRPSYEREWTKNSNGNMRSGVTTSNSINNYDNSIIDVTGDTYRIITNSNLKKYSNGIPYWEHHYVYSYSEINNASSAQKQFYFHFKNSFLNGIYYDLEGNTNYAFILLFDILDGYEGHNDISVLEQQIKALGQCYPKTKSYGISFLIKKMEIIGDSEGITKLRAVNGYSYQNNQIDYYTYDWRNKYKKKLNLNNEDAELLNKVWISNNNFCSIEFCCLEIIKLYISTINELKRNYIREETTIEQQFSIVADVIARKHFNYRTGSMNYKYCIESTTNEIYGHIFRYVENTVRENYGHKRKLNTDLYYTSLEAKAEFESRIVSKTKEILSILVLKIAPPDEATEVELYAQNTSRWKIKFEELTKDFKGSQKQFIDDIISLGKLNSKNPSIEIIFFEASKFISQKDKEAALILYMHYLYHDLKSVTFDNRQLTKTIQKNLFSTNEQLHDFEIIVSQLISDKDLEKALQGVSKIYVKKRKKIQLDTTSIKEVQQQHAGTVELLNEYLKDEYEDEHDSVRTQEINNEEVNIEIIPKVEAIQSSIFIKNIQFTQLHTNTLEIFAKNSFSVSKIEIESFAKSKGVFKNQLVESINDICYDTLDDVLIEEEDEYYTINDSYYQRLLIK
jgi:hypothetical protein